MVVSYIFQYYSFTTFAMMLNEVDADLCKKLPPTDARRRPDIRKMEEGDLGLLFVKLTYV